MTTSYTPEQNGVAERKNRMTVEMTRNILKPRSLKYGFWTEVVHMTVYLLNRCPTKAVEGKTPREAWTSKKQTVQHLRVFGCMACSSNPGGAKQKCLFVGYSLEGKGYRPGYDSTRFCGVSVASELRQWGIKSAPVSQIQDFTSFPTYKAALEAGEGSSLLAFYADHHVVPLPEGHRFPMDKYQATRSSLEGDASLSHLLITRPSLQAAFEELSLVHEERYIRSIFRGELNPQEQRAVGFPWSPELVRRSCASTGGTISAMHSVMLGLRRAAANIAGGTHHAFPDHGEGFCVFNDIAVASAVALKTYPDKCNVERPILVIDLDVHQGNGTAKIFEDEERVITFSMHGENNYPWRTRMNSNYDVDLPDKTDDGGYLAVLSDWLPRLFSSHNPALVFFQAGVDALQEDSFGRLSMSRQGLLRRNNMVYTVCLERKLPLVITMGGGYSRPPQASIQAHADVYRSAALRYGAN